MHPRSRRSTPSQNILEIIVADESIKIVKPSELLPNAVWVSRLVSSV